ncbi:hypothetical protein Back2_28920 [Nocardioides baekrokdamisoli]|uniref:Peptidase S26 domain-containing protein n=1 Tax=Nocardioides baekrokdamisoli TaxID=1804624 RepID=A0A3G9IRL2_9ACTN|nr:S26 family signal peptidase [Nocardioides baekrokdamisoli]BBH18605.1 hypothetical protein Back2_28920 [Nocardioides baekrokdamisoli]
MDPWVRIVGWIVLAGVVGMLLFAGVWRVSGGRLEVVRSPSMGTVAPVGSLIWTRPVDVASLKVGDFISFHPPGAPNVTYSHRVWSINGDGTVSTKGVIPAVDPWKLRDTNLVGRVEMTWPGVGWLVVCAPIFFVAAIVIAATRRLLRRKWRLAATLVMVALAIDIALVWHKPLLNGELVASHAARTGGEASFVSTGLMPLRVTAVGGSSVVLASGEVGTVSTDVKGSDGEYHVHLDAAISWWFWVLLVLGCLAIPLYGLVVGFPPRPADPDESSNDDTDGPGNDTVA